MLIFELEIVTLKKIKLALSLKKIYETIQTLTKKYLLQRFNIKKLSKPQDTQKYVNSQNSDKLQIIQGLISKCNQKWKFIIQMSASVSYIISIVLGIFKANSNAYKEDLGQLQVLQKIFCNQFKWQPKIFLGIFMTTVGQLSYMKYSDQLKIQVQEEILEKFSILYNYLMFNEIQQLAILICKHNKQLQESISMYQYLKQQECQIDKTINVDKLIESYENLTNEQNVNQNKNDATWYKILICCAKLLSKQIQSEEDTKIYNKIHKQLNFYIDQNLPSNNPNIIISQISMFHLPGIQYIQLYSSFQLLINTLRHKQYIEFTEKNYQYQTQLLPNILNISSKQSSFHTQIWKFQSILIDVTQNLVNFNELFSVTQHSFKNEGIQRIAFSFNNIQRGFKVMKIILEESILKYFYEQIELKIEEYKSVSHNQIQQKESIQFKPQVHIVFHGLEDINLDNPKQTKLDLEIQIQIGENEFLSLNNQSNNQTLIWNYDKIKHFNLIIQLLVQIFECSQLWIQYMPKSPKEYFEFLCSKVSKQKLEVDRQTLTNWFQKEKPHINNSIESLLALLESIEFLLLKIESNINKEIAKYQKEKPISFNKDKFAKVLIQSGFKIEYDLINKIELRLAETIKNNLESILNQISPKTQQIKGIVQLIKKITPNFK